MSTAQASHHSGAYNYFLNMMTYQVRANSFYSNDSRENVTTIFFCIILTNFRPYCPLRTIFFGCDLNCFIKLPLYRTKCSVLSDGYRLPHNLHANIAFWQPLGLYSLTSIISSDQLLRSIHFFHSFYKILIKYWLLNFENDGVVVLYELKQIDIMESTFCQILLRG